MGKTRLVLLTVMGIFISGCMLPFMDLEEEMCIRKSQIEAEIYIEQHPELDERIKGLILDNKIGVGMTKEQVMLITHYAYQSHRTEPTSKYGADEMWIYKSWYATKKGDFIRYKHLYFKDDVLIKIDEIRTDKKVGFFD